MSTETKGEIKNIAIYPIKSARRIELPEARMTPMGLETIDGALKDHEFMIVSAHPNEDGVREFVQQRQKGMNVLTQLIPSYSEGQMILHWKGEDKITINLAKKNPEIIRVQVWNDICSAEDQGDEVAMWLSWFLKKTVRLVRVGESFQRKARQTYLPSENEMRFQDGYPIHWFPISDVEELNEKISDDQRISWERFRPQIVAAGFPAQFVHTILEMTIAGVPCIQPKPCERCPIPQIDQDTGEKGAQPNRTLMEYKVWENIHGVLKPIFGENVNPLADGIIRVGDEIVVLRKRENPLKYGSLVKMKGIRS